LYREAANKSSPCPRWALPGPLAETTVVNANDCGAYVLRDLAACTHRDRYFTEIRLREHLEHGQCYFTFSCASTFTWLTTSMRPTTSPKLSCTGARTDIQPGLLVTVTRCPVFNTVSICGIMSP